MCALAIRPGFIMSGSWDKTARIWQFDGSTVLTLTGHTAAIWAVEVLKCSASPSEIITLTGSADKTIKMWRVHNENVQYIYFIIIILIYYSKL